MTQRLICVQDVQTCDIDYMDRQRDFTYDPVNWGDMPDLINELHNDNIKVTLILVRCNGYVLYFY